MKAMILAAGRGERMLPLTEHTPKPLLEVAGVPLIEYHLNNLTAVGFSEIVINVSHLGEQIEERLGNGSRWGCAIQYSREVEPLESAGGIIHALPLLGNAPFALVNGDTWTDFPLQRLHAQLLDGGNLAHLVLANNPPQHPQGDFSLDVEGRLQGREATQEDNLTYAGLAVYQADFFAGMGGKQAMLPLLERAIHSGQATGEYYPGQWHDVGTPQRLQALNEQLGRH